MHFCCCCFEHSTDKEYQNSLKYYCYGNTSIFNEYIGVDEVLPAFHVVVSTVVVIVVQGPKRSRVSEWEWEWEAPANESAPKFVPNTGTAICFNQIAGARSID